MDGELLCLKWRDHTSSLFRTLSSVRKKEVYCDATLACQGRFYPVHKFVLSTCSDYFEQMFEMGDQRNLMIVLTDIGCEELETLLDYMYFGEVNVLQSDLNRFMKAAERLRIKGLAEPSEVQDVEESREKRSRPQHESSQESKRKKWSHEVPHRDSQNVAAMKSHEVQGCRSDISSESRVNESHDRRTESMAVNMFTPPVSEEMRLESNSTVNAGGTGSIDDIHNGEPNLIKLEPPTVKDESQDWHHGTADANHSIFMSQPSMDYLAPTSAVTTNASAVSPVHHGSMKSHQPDYFSGPPQPLPGPSGLQGQTWDQGPHAIPVQSDEYTHFRASFPRYGMGPRKTGRPTSDIWNHYKTEKSNGKNYVICIYCTNQKYGYPNATKMKIHTVKCSKCPEDVRRQYKKELSQMVTKSDASKSVVV